MGSTCQKNVEATPGYHITSDSGVKAARVLRALK
jgi:hypothetical protein